MIWSYGHRGMTCQRRHENITEKEILEIANLGIKHGIEIILQPKMPISKNLDMTGIFQKLYKKYSRIRLIPQVHKYLNLP